MLEVNAPFSAYRLVPVHLSYDKYVIWGRTPTADM